MTSRRGFLAALVAAPVAAVTAMKGGGVRRAVGAWSPMEFYQAQYRVWRHQAGAWRAWEPGRLFGFSNLPTSYLGRLGFSVVDEFPPSAAPLLPAWDPTTGRPA